MQPRQKGQGLLDVLIALLIIAFGTLALIRYQSQLSLSEEVVRQQTDANILAASQIDSLSDYTTLTGYNNIATNTTTNTSIAANTTYTITSTVTNNANPIYKTLDVNVTWTDRAGTARNIRQVSKIAWMDPTYSAEVM